MINIQCESTFKKQKENIPSSSVVKTSPSIAGCAALIRDQEANIPHALWPKNQNIKQKQYCNKFNIDFKNDPQQQSIKKKKKQKEIYNALPKGTNLKL